MSTGQEERLTIEAPAIEGKEGERREDEEKKRLKNLTLSFFQIPPQHFEFLFGFFFHPREPTLRHRHKKDPG